MARGAAGGADAFTLDVVDAGLRAVVDTVSVDRAAARPGVTVGGSNVHVVCGGRFPLAQLSVISVL